MSNLIVRVLIILGLFSFSRLLTILIDVHRASIIGFNDQAILNIFFCTIDRGSLYNSILVGSFGVMIPVVVAFFLAVIITVKTKQKERKAYGMIFKEMLGGITIRLPMIFGVGIVVIYSIGKIFIVEDLLSLLIWIAFFTFGLIEMWRVAGKIASIHNASPRLIVPLSIGLFILLAVIVVIITYLIGGFG